MNSTHLEPITFRAAILDDRNLMSGYAYGQGQGGGRGQGGSAGQQYGSAPYHGQQAQGTQSSSNTYGVAQVRSLFGSPFIRRSFCEDVASTDRPIVISGLQSGTTVPTVWSPSNVAAIHRGVHFPRSFDGRIQHRPVAAAGSAGGGFCDRWHPGPR